MPRYRPEDFPEVRYLEMARRLASTYHRHLFRDFPQDVEQIVVLAALEADALEAQPAKRAIRASLRRAMLAHGYRYDYNLSQWTRLLPPGPAVLSYAPATPACGVTGCHKPGAFKHPQLTLVCRHHHLRAKAGRELTLDFARHLKGACAHCAREITYPAHRKSCARHFCSARCGVADRRARRSLVPRT